MADLSVLTRLDRLELIELVSVLAYGIGGMPDRAVDEARFHAATRRVERAGEAVTAALADYTRTKAFHDQAIAEKRPSTVGKDLVRLAEVHRKACAREREAWARLGRLQMEERR